MSQHKDVTLLTHSMTDRTQFRHRKLSEDSVMILPIQTSLPNQERFF